MLGGKHFGVTPITRSIGEPFEAHSKESEMTDRQTTEQNKQLATNFLEAVTAKDWERLLSLLDDSFTWWVSGKLAISGTYSKQETGEMLRQLVTLCKVTPVLKPFAFTAEGDRVAVEAEGIGEMLDGQTYHNIYHLLFEVRDGRIVKLRDYMDTMHVNETFVAAASAGAGAETAS